MSRRVELRPLTVTVIRRFASASRTSAAGTLSTAKETMPDGRRPRSATVTPGISPSSERRRAAQPLAPRAGERVDAEAAHVDLELAHRLARVEEHEAADAVHELRRLRDRVDEAAVRRYVHERDDPHALVERPLERVEVELAGRVGRHHLDARVVLPRPLEGRDRVARVLGAREQDPVSGGERHRVEELRPRAGRAVQERDVFRGAAEEPREAVAHAGEVGGALLLRRVAAHRGLAPQVSDDRLQDRRRRQRGAGAVEEDAVPAAGRLGPDALEVDHSPASSRSCCASETSTSGPARTATVASHSSRSNGTSDHASGCPNSSGSRRMRGSTSARKVTLTLFGSTARPCPSAFRTASFRVQQARKAPARAFGGTASSSARSSSANAIRATSASTSRSSRSTSTPTGALETASISREPARERLKSNCAAGWTSRR